MMKKLYTIIPRPCRTICEDGKILIKDSLNIVTPNEAIISESIFAIYEKCGLSIHLNNKPEFKEVTEIFTILEKNNDSPESYTLKISQEKIEIKANSKEGIFYGLITFCQLAFNAKFENNEIPAGTIIDAPTFSWRGFLLDTCRSFYSTDFIKKMLDIMALYKLNRFHWHLTDDQGWRFQVEEFPRLTEIGSVRKVHTMPEANEGDYEGITFEKQFYSDSEIKEIVEYAKERNITVIPEVEFPGHSSALLASYPEYGCTKGPYKVENRWGIFPDTVCLGEEKTFAFYEKVFEKIEKLFPSEYIHIGGDECLSERWQKCPKCQEVIKREKMKNPSELQSWGTKRISELLKTHNKIAIGWDEILNNTETFPLPEEVIVQSWQGVEGGEKAAALNHKVIMSPQTHCYLNLKNKASVEEPGRLGVTTLEKSYNYSPITEKMDKKSILQILGGECALWTEELRYSKNAEYLLFPRFCSIAECLWLSPENKNYELFLENINRQKPLLEMLNINYCR